MKSRFALFLFFILSTFQIFAQCGNRYKKKIFPEIDKIPNVMFSTANNDTLNMDIYVPLNDTASHRTVLILAHGGGFIMGDKGDGNICGKLCQTFAHRGYVTANIQYRLTSEAAMEDSIQAYTEVVRAISDGKAAVRFFRKDAATDNIYKINPNWIFAGGNSAGGVLFMQVMYLDSINEAPIAMQSIIRANGGIVGNSGNPGYPSKIQGVLSLAGGLISTSFIGPGSGPSFNAQGDQDRTVPYFCGESNLGTYQLRLCGLGNIEPIYNQYNINHLSLIYPGEGHVPWDHNVAEQIQIDSTAANFFYSLICNHITSDHPRQNEPNVLLHPNPCGSYFDISSDIILSEVTLLNDMGQCVKILKNESIDNHLHINTTGLQSGVYIAKIEFKNRSIVPIIKQIVITQ